MNLGQAFAKKERALGRTLRRCIEASRSCRSRQARSDEEVLVQLPCKKHRRRYSRERAPWTLANISHMFGEERRRSNTHRPGPPRRPRRRRAAASGITGDCRMKRPQRLQRLLRGRQKSWKKQRRPPQRGPRRRHSRRHSSEAAFLRSRRRRRPRSG